MSAKKSIAIYDSDQLDEYEQAISYLKTAGKVDEDTAEGEKLATLAREYTSRFDSDDEHNTQTESSWSDFAELGIGIVGFFMVVLALLGGLVAAVAWLFGVNLQLLIAV